jgi:sugar phosphate isomerase/epimerase
MHQSKKREIYFSFFMFTADLKPDDTSYTQVLIKHLRALSEMGYDGFDMHIAPKSGKPDYKLEIDNYKRLKEAFNNAGFGDKKFTTNVGTTQVFDPTSPYEEQRGQALLYLKSRIDITSVLADGEESIMSGPFLYPYGVFPLTDTGAPIWSDALLDWLQPRYAAAGHIFKQLAEYASTKRVKLAIEPVKSWETPGPNMVSDVLDFIDSVDAAYPIGATVDTAQVVMESQGPEIFKKNLARATEKNRLYYVHISAPDRGAISDCWLPWDIMLPELEPIFQGPYLIEVFNAIPPFDSSMRMSRRRFWRPGEDKAEQNYPSAYQIAEAGLAALKNRLHSF